MLLHVPFVELTTLPLIETVGGVMLTGRSTVGYVMVKGGVDVQEVSVNLGAVPLICIVNETRGGN